MYKKYILTTGLKSFTNIFHDIKFDTKYLRNLQEQSGIMKIVLSKT